MINSRSVSYKSKRTQKMLFSPKDERPLGVQLLGCEAKFVQRALDVINEYEFDILDFNAACPAKKVVRRGEGASLLREPKKLNALLKLLVENSHLPVTVKIRAGWDHHSLNAQEVALWAQDAGISALFIHGRTKLQGYSGKVDYAIIRRVKAALEIPVIASGDIFSQELISKMFTETNCDGVAIARGALGNPWIFNGQKPEKDEIIKVMLTHLAAYIDFYGERIGVVKFRKFFSWYTKGFRKIRLLRDKVSQVKTKEDMSRIIERLAALP
jgi:tRNA-dihydrouridine synthase B